MTSSIVRESPWWPAPTPSGALHATVPVPGSKSQTNRLLLLAALAAGPSVIHGALRSRDTELMIAALQQFGARIEPDWSGQALTVTPIPLGSEPPWATTPPRGSARPDVGLGDDAISDSISIDVGLAGTVMRFLPPVAMLVGGRIKFDGDPAARLRPMRGLLDALVALGAQVDYLCEPGLLPFVIEHHGPVPGGTITVDASDTSQFVSGLLLAAPRFTDGLCLRPIGTVPSQPHIDMTLAALRERGVSAAVDGSQNPCWMVKPGPISGGQMWVEPDLSNAAPFLAAALVTGGQVTVPGWPTASTQPGMMVPALLEQMGGQARQSAAGLTITGTGQLHGIEVDLSAAGELAPTFVALAALAASPGPGQQTGQPSRFTGIGHLRGHETDRLAALAREINRLGGNATELLDGIEIRPAPLHGGDWQTYDDHRMATAGALIGLRVPGTRVENIETTAKTLPDFPALWERLLGHANIADGDADDVGAADVDAAVVDDEVRHP